MLIRAVVGGFEYYKIVTVRQNVTKIAQDTKKRGGDM